MAINAASVNTATDAFYDWITKTNFIANAISTVVMTANASGSNTTGNATLIGQFTANTVSVVNGIHGGTVLSPNTLYISSAFQCNSSQINAGTVSYTTNSPNQLVDQFATSAFRSAKYLLLVNTAVGFQTTEILLLQDGTNVFLTEYATLANNGQQAVFTASISGSYVNLTVTPTATTSSVSYQRTTINV